MFYVFITDHKGRSCFHRHLSFYLQSASWLLVHCSSLLRRGRYASYWNAFLLKFILYLYVFVIVGSTRRATSNKIGQLPHDFFREFTEIQFLDIQGTHINVWPNFTLANKLTTLYAADVALTSANAPEEIGNVPKLCIDKEYTHYKDWWKNIA